MSPRDTSISHRSPAALAAVRRSDRQRVARMLIILFVAAGLIATLTTRASGQYDPPIKITVTDPDLIGKMTSAAKSFASTAPANEKAANYFYRVYVPAKLTHPEALTECNELVDNATEWLSRAQRGNNPRARKILGWLFTGMKSVAEGNYYPHARIRALLVLGSLDAKPVDQVNATPPVPLSYSLPILLAQYNNESNVDGIRAAALQGLHRYVSYGFNTLSGNDKTTIQTAMTKLLESDPPSGRSDAAHAYLQRFAVDILDTLRTTKDPKLAVQLIAISTEPKKHDLIALHSITRASTMTEELKGKVADPEKVLGSWGRRALRAFEGELARLNALDRAPNAKQQPKKPEDYLNRREEKKEEATDDIMAEGGMNMEGLMQDEPMDGEGEGELGDGDVMGMMGLMGMDGLGGGVGATANPQPPEVIAARRKINHVLQQIHVGATGSPMVGMPKKKGGMLLMVTPEQEPLVETWVNTMEPVVDAINDPLLDSRSKFVDGLTAQIEALRELVGEEPATAPAAEAAAPAEPAADDAAAPPADAGVDPAAPKAPAPADPGPDPAKAPAAPPKLPVEDELG